MAPPLLIADVPWLLYRSFFALPRSIRGAGGSPVNALLGTVNALLAAIDADPPRAVVCCLGAEDARYRVELYPSYHAHREEMPEELAAQWPLAPALLEAFGWTVFDAGELEADDAIGAFAAAEEAAGGSALLLTGDRDLYQAVTPDVSVLQLKGREGTSLIGPVEVIAKVGVEPALVPDLIALRGDPSDGLPGAPGIGAKTAASLLSEHRSLEGVLAAAAADACTPDPGPGTAAAGEGPGAGTGQAPPVKPRIAAILRQHAEQLVAFKRIATLMPVKGASRPADAPTDFARGAAAARELGMERLAERLEGLSS